MTTKQINQLNVKIARKLGWKDLKKENLPAPLQSETRTIGIAPGNERHQYVPNYFGNLAYAMKLVDWAGENGYAFTLTRYPDIEDKKLDKYVYPSECYHARFNIYGYQFGGEDTATLPSVAICLAFLKIK